jgi:hypothetical protein
MIRIMNCQSSLSRIDAPINSKANGSITIFVAQLFQALEAAFVSWIVVLLAI